MYERVSAWVLANRRRIAGALAIVFVFVLAIDLSGTVPRPTVLAFDLGAGHEAVRTVELTYTAGDDELVEHARHRYAEGAPERITDELDLLPGAYDVRIDLEYGDGRREARQGHFDAPGEGLVVVSCR